MPDLTIIPPATIKLRLGVGQGPAGISGGLSSVFQHDQSSPSDTWVCNHNLGFHPNAGVFSVGGVEMLAEVVQVSINQVVIYFDSPTAGFAVFS